MTFWQKRRVFAAFTQYGGNMDECTVRIAQSLLAYRCADAADRLFKRCPCRITYGNIRYRPGFRGSQIDNICCFISVEPDFDIIHS